MWWKRCLKKQKKDAKHGRGYPRQSLSNVLWNVDPIISVRPVLWCWWSLQKTKTKKMKEECVNGWMGINRGVGEWPTAGGLALFWHCFCQLPTSCWGMFCLVKLEGEEVKWLQMWRPTKCVYLLFSCPFHHRPQGPSASAIEQWVFAERQACPSNGAVRFLMRCSQVPPNDFNEKYPRWANIFKSRIGKAYLSDRLRSADSIVVNDSDHQYDLLDLLKWYLKGEGLVVVGIQCALFDRRLFLLQSFAYKVITLLKL